MMAEKSVFEQELLLLRIERRRLLAQKPLMAGLTDKVRQKAAGLADSISRAFTEGLAYFLDEDGTALIEKALPVEKLLEEYRQKEAAICERPSFAALAALDRTAFHSRAGNLTATALEGAGLGLLGIGLPDIPLFLGVLLKTVRETALRYGYRCDGPWEQSYLLRVVCGSLTAGEAGKKFWDEADRMAAGLDQRSGDPVVADLEEMTAETAKQLSAALLAAKFVQGIAVIGAAGGAFNVMVLRRAEKGAALMYKARRLEKLRWELA